MSTPLLIVLIVVAVLLVGLLIAALVHRSGADRRRTQGTVEARARRAEADRLGSAADDRQATAEQLRGRAAEEREQVEVHARRADELEQAATEREHEAKQASSEAERNLARADKVDPGT